ncbi:diacylglycerol/lipid kinase family protein [Agromyces archimandritae]|uniref:Diacylglycerol kinase n=1 Tax=Agromyces archimandritae TaxID=2781962 RepID=A0A975FLR2_9MICO|nr:diacylglycerol kinase family protein [Agromyces archimandritae]QTX04434.1 diacylglycerol kinase [Agromyces archimandritae]
MQHPGIRRLVVAVNPSASFGRHRAVGAAVVARLEAAGYAVEMLQEPNAALLDRELRSALGHDPDGVVVVGGDGLVSLALNAIGETGIPLGLVPTGTGNDLARGLGIPHDDPTAATDALLAALDRPPRAIDAVRTGDGRWFAGVLSAGFDAVVNERANRMRRPRGASRYTIALVRELLGYRARPYVLEIDGERREVRAMLISVANNASIGGGMRIVPHAALDDGLLDVFIVHPLPRIGLLRVFPRVFSGTHIDHPAVEFRTAKRVRIDGDAVAYADGERLGELPIEAEVQPGALRVFA